MFNLNKCVNTIHKCIYDNRGTILSRVMMEGDENVAVKQVYRNISQNLDVAIYPILEISLNARFSAIREVFNVWFLSIIPQNSTLIAWGNSCLKFKILGYSYIWTTFNIRKDVRITYFGEETLLRHRVSWSVRRKIFLWRYK